MKYRLIYAGLAAVLTSGTASADLFGVYSNIRTYTAGGPTSSDTHEYLGYSPVPSLTGHSEASFDSGTYSASAVGDTFVTYGSLHVSQHGSSIATPNNASLAVVTSDGNPAAAYYDRLFINGANTGATVTIHVAGWLSDVTRVSGNHWAAWNVPQGLNGGITVAGHNTVPVQDFNASADVHVTGPQYFDVTGVVGSYLDISSYLYADLDTIDTFGQGSFSATAETVGTLNSTFTSDNPDVTITSASGHDYAAVPEPATLSVLGLGIISVIRRRKKS